MHGVTVVRKHLPTAEELRARRRRLALVLVQQEAHQTAASRSDAAAEGAEARSSVTLKSS